MIDDSFSLMRGGLVYRALHSMGLMGHDRHTSGVVAMLLTLVAVAPLLVLTALDRTLLPGFTQVAMPLLGDYALIARFLLAMPLLVLAAPACDRFARQALVQLSRSRLVDPVLRVPFDAEIARMKRLRDSNMPELACLLLAVAPALFDAVPVGLLRGVSDWAHIGSEPTPAGYWLALVSTSIFRFVSLVWLWRFLLWAWLLWRLSRLDLDVRAAHPDGAGGLGFLGAVQQRFGILALAGGLLLTGYCMNHMIHLGQPLGAFQHLLVAYVLTAVLVILAPLLVMAPLLARAKRNGILLYGRLGQEAAHAFDRRWLAAHPGDTSLLDVGDASAICDLTGVYATVRGMAIIPVSRWNMAWLAACAALPLAPLAFVAFSFNEILQHLASILT
ncbi:hypothetical protein [Pseudoxanthomonas sp. 10H]|uniref:hypothetical protein n=1 Tax=Pseudoxanthomonas sp. 10H TaxID=3242729 RepID=UPI003557B8CB